MSILKVDSKKSSRSSEKSSRSSEKSSWTCKYDVGMGYYYECPKCKLRIDAKDIVLGRMNIETCPQCHISMDSNQEDYDKLSNWLQTERDYKEF